MENIAKMLSRALVYMLAGAMYQASIEVTVRILETLDHAITKRNNG